MCGNVYSMKFLQLLTGLECPTFFTFVNVCLVIYIILHNYIYEKRIL